MALYIAQWEKAARGTDGRTYPWGNQEPDETLMDILGNQLGNEVGSYPLGVSPYGVFDMAGEVSEWVSDWYSEDSYLNNPFENPTGPETGANKVVRGVPFLEKETFKMIYFISNRVGQEQSYGNQPVGFRCVYIP